MHKGLYSGASALNVLMRQQEMISGNLANLQTGGHRRVFQTLEERTSADGTSLPGTRQYSEAVDFSQGTIKTTGNQFDVAITGDGFLSVSDGDQTLYTRNGSLHRTDQGMLVNGDGMPVLGTGGPITIDPGVSDSEITIDETGTVSGRGQQFGQIVLTAFADNSKLVPRGQMYFSTQPDAVSETATGRLIQGSEEMSNAHPVTELVSLIVTSRMFEAAQRSIRTISETVQQNYRE